MNTSQYLFCVLDQQGTPSQHSEQGQNITAYGVVYKKTFSVKLSVPYSTSQHSLLYRVMATLCYSLNRDEIPNCGLEQGRNFTYEIFPDSENTLQVRCVINVLSSQHNKSHFRIRFQLADTRTNELLMEYTTWTNPIWVVSKSKLTAGSNRQPSTSRSKNRNNNTSPPPASVPAQPTPFPIEPITSTHPIQNTSSDMLTIVDLLNRVLKGQEQHQDQLNNLIRHQAVTPALPCPDEPSLKRSSESIESDFEHAFRHVKKPKYSEDTDKFRKLAEKYQEEIKILYSLLPEPELVCPVSSPGNNTERAHSTVLGNITSGTVAGSNSTSSATIDFPDMEFLPQLDEFVWTE